MDRPAISFTAVYLKSKHGYVGFVEELPALNSLGQSIEEARANLRLVRAGEGNRLRHRHAAHGAGWSDGRRFGGGLRVGASAGRRERDERQREEESSVTRTVGHERCYQKHAVGQVQ